MADTKDKNADTLGIDFSALMADDSVTVDSSKTVDDDHAQVAKAAKDANKDAPEDIDVNKVLANMLGDKEEEPTKPEDKKAAAPKVDDTLDDKADKSKDTKKVDTGDEPFALTFAKYQYEQGVISEVDEETIKKIAEEEGEAAAVSYVIAHELDINRAQLLEHYNEQFNKFVELTEGGVPHEEAADIVKLTSQITSITPEDLKGDDKEDLRRSILTAYYKNTMVGASDAKIKKIVDNHIALSEDVEEATNALEELKAIAKKKEEEAIIAAKQREEAYKQSIQQYVESVKKTVGEIDEIIPGQRINKQTRQKMEELILKPHTTDAQGRALNGIWAKRAENPQKFDAILAYMVATGAFDGKWNKVADVKKSKVVDELEEHLKRKSYTSSLGSSATKRGEDIDGRDYLESMKKVFS